MCMCIVYCHFTEYFFSSFLSVNANHISQLISFNFGIHFSRIYIESHDFCVWLQFRLKNVLFALFFVLYYFILPLCWYTFQSFTLCIISINLWTSTLMCIVQWIFYGKTHLILGVSHRFQYLYFLSPSFSISHSFLSSSHSPTRLRLHHTNFLR